MGQEQSCVIAPGWLTIVQMLAHIVAGGSSSDIGHALGNAGRAAIAARLRATRLWQEVTAPAHRAQVQRMARTTSEAFPGIHAELTALADGMDVPFEQVMAWNARGDLMAGACEGCTTVQLPGDVPVIAHNEDGLPALSGACMIAGITPLDAPRIVSFCYPGSIPGHTFAATSAGLVMTVNNLRLAGLRPEIPRMVLTRALLAAPDRDTAVEILRTSPPSGGFHLSLGQVGAQDIWSVSFGGGEVVVKVNTAPALHANHALVAGAVLSRQIITDSSRDRQARGEALLAEGRDALDILRDSNGPGLPIFRDAPDDPDDENTLAQFHAMIGPAGIDWQIHPPGRRAPALSGFLPAG